MPQSLKYLNDYKASEPVNATIGAVRNIYRSLMATIVRDLPKGRAKDISITHLEASAMWAIQALAADSPDSEKVA